MYSIIINNIFTRISVDSVMRSQKNNWKITKRQIFWKNRLKLYHITIDNKFQFFPMSQYLYSKSDIEVLIFIGSPLSTDL